MMRFTEIADDLIKAIGHKYIRRIPKGVTKTGGTKYVYVYAGKEGRNTTQDGHNDIKQKVKEQESADIMHTTVSDKTKTRRPNKKQAPSIPFTTAMANLERVRQLQQTPPESFDDKFKRLVANPKQLSRRVTDMKELPVYLYAQHADHVIDKYLSDPKLGTKYNDIPNVRDMLKEQIRAKQGSSILGEKDFKQLKNTVEFIALRNEEISFTSPLFSFLLEPSALNNLFDRHALDEARAFSENSSSYTNKKQAPSIPFTTAMANLDRVRQLQQRPAKKEG